MRLFGIDVDPSLRRDWLEWLAPQAQPFFLTEAQAAACDVTVGDAWGLSDELRDTYASWRVAKDLRVAWLAEDRFSAMPRGARSVLVRAQVTHRRGLIPTVHAWPGHGAQADGHRFVWWPSMLADADDATVELVIRSFGEVRASRHREVSADVWASAAVVLPCVRELAGTFCAGSGPNCFGTVMAAAGVPGAAAEWMQREPFEQWLRGSARAGGDDAAPGTVLVWRDADGAAVHAAVTLGGGWAFHKPSQGWMTPRKVLAVRDVIRASRSVGVRLHRYALGGSAPSGYRG